ncbi:MAG: allantoate amidohydrolase [Vicinamibacterales bacterium]
MTTAQEVIDCCHLLANCTEEPGQTTRTFLSAPMHQVHAHLSAWMTRLGMTVSVDGAGNIRGVQAGAPANGPRLLIGSHLDTVPNAGAFDGILGVVAGIALIDILQQTPLPFAIEVVGFSEEEGVRFGVPFIGSRALAGTLTADVLNRQDGSGRDVRDALVDFGLNPQDITAMRVPVDAIGYVEFHIEQGPVLESRSASVGVVHAIAGQSRLDVEFIGSANHAGTTPMSLRRDALAGAAEWVGVCERVARAHDGLVATVGRIDARPGATNVIAGRCVASLDVRHADDDVRRSAVGIILAEAGQVALRRHLEITTVTRLDQAATPLSPPLVALFQDAVARVGLPVHRMTSGAGHDAMVVAGCMPAAMLFVRSPGGISHHPDETVRLDDVADMLAVGVAFIEELARRQA